MKQDASLARAILIAFISAIGVTAALLAFGNRLALIGGVTAITVTLPALWLLSRAQAAEAADDDSGPV
jgi:energy-converting hydrogenase Eha subunit E